MNAPSKFWSIFGKLSIAITTLASIAGLWIIISDEKEDVSLWIEPHEFTLHPILQQQIESNFDAFSYSKLSEFAESVYPDDYKKRDDLRKKIEFMHSDSWLGQPEYSLDRYEGFSTVVVSNTGSISAKNVKIDIPTSGISKAIRSDDNSIVSEKFDQIINLDEIRAKNHVVLKIWTSRELNRYDLEKINITHENGMGSVVWPIEATGLTRLLQKYIFLFYGIIWIIFICGVFIGSFGSKFSYNNETDPEKDEVQPVGGDQ